MDIQDGQIGIYGERERCFRVEWELGIEVRLDVEEGKQIGVSGF